MQDHVTGWEPPGRHTGVDGEPSVVIGREVESGGPRQAQGAFRLGLIVRGAVPHIEQGARIVLADCRDLRDAGQPQHQCRRQGRLVEQVKMTAWSARTAAMVDTIWWMSAGAIVSGSGSISPPARAPPDPPREAAAPPAPRGPAASNQPVAAVGKGAQGPGRSRAHRRRCRAGRPGSSSYPAREDQVDCRPRSGAVTGAAATSSWRVAGWGRDALRAGRLRGSDIRPDVADHDRALRRDTQSRAGALDNVGFGFRHASGADVVGQISQTSKGPRRASIRAFTAAICSSR